MKHILWKRIVLFRASTTYFWTRKKVSLSNFTLFWGHLMKPVNKGGRKLKDPVPAWCYYHHNQILVSHLNKPFKDRLKQSSKWLRVGSGHEVMSTSYSAAYFRFPCPPLNWWYICHSSFAVSLSSPVSSAQIYRLPIAASASTVLQNIQTTLGWTTSSRVFTSLFQSYLLSFFSGPADQLKPFTI